jgi:3-phenylpropionate/trans-cinnamate dioxygenase ferredoxin subunit
VLVDGKEIGVMRWNDEFFAARNVCPHAGAYLCAFVRAHLAPGPEAGTFEVRDDQPVVACAWHHYEFDLKTGRCTADPKLKIKLYPVVVGADGMVCVDLPKRGHSTDRSVDSQ